MGVWPVFVPLIEADVLINLPVAKHHSLSSLTLGMKNWIGGVAGSRWSLHQDINQSIVDLAHLTEEKPDAPVVKLSIEQLYDSALMQEGLLPNPADMLPRIQELIEIAVKDESA